jgi:hypothetical protein
MFESRVNLMQLHFQIFKHTQTWRITWHIVGYFVENYASNIDVLDNFVGDRLQK